MRIVGCEILHCNAGWRDFSFLKLKTDENITGISEYNECYGSPGLSGIIRRLVERVREYRRSRSEPVQVWRMHFGLAQELSNGTQVIDSNHQHVVPLFCVSLRQRCSAAAQNQGQSSHLKRPAPPKRWAHFNDAFTM